MIIGVDGNEANVKEKVGVSVYTLELLRYFQKNSQRGVCFMVFLKNEPNSQLPPSTEHFKYRIVKGNFLWSQLFLPLTLYLKRDIDMFFSPAHYAPRFCPVPTVVTVHDLSYFYYPEEFLKKDLYQLHHWTKYSVDKAQKIIAVSKTTKKDLIKLYDVAEEKIEVIYNGFRKFETQPNTMLNTLNLTSHKYILYVGTLQPRKNITTLLHAFQSFLKKTPHYSLVIVGKKGWLYEDIFDKVKELGLEQNVVFTGYLPDEVLATLYQNASLFVLPSLYEGFGLPLLEAMSMGCPVISSFTSSLPEVGADACLYFDPKNPAELSEKMHEVVHNTLLRQELIQKGKKRVEYFSWEKCGKETFEMIKSVLKI